MPFKNEADKKLYQSEYYQINKERLREEKQKSEHCITCNKYFFKGYLSKHLKTALHKKKSQLKASSN